MQSPIQVFRFLPWERLRRRFLLEEAAVTGKTLSPEIVPVTQVDALLVDIDTGSVSVDLSAAAGSHVAAYTVPEGRRATIRVVVLSLLAAASRVTVNDLSTGVTIFLTASGTAEQVLNDLSLQLEAGDSVGALTTGNVGDNAANYRYLVEEIDAFT